MRRVILDPSEIFQALADKTRIRIMRLMVTFPKEEVCLCEMTDSLLEPEYNISRHLKILRQSGLLSSFKEGRWVYHQIVNDTAILKYLYKVVTLLPDVDGTYAQDAKRFKKQMSARTRVRCVRNGPTSKTRQLDVK